MMETSDLDHIKRAITLANRGIGFVNPNPLVGAVIVKDGRVIGEGWHERYGGWHAERNALLHCTEDPRGATMYVTLEPCCHQGKTPPCTRAIIARGIARVVVGIQDPNPLVSGKGIALLRAAGIQVDCGFEQETIRHQNRVFLKYIQQRLPWVILKTAMTLDGKIATPSGDSRWVTGEPARLRVHEMRHRFMAIAVGIGTVLADDPMLNCRLPGREVRQPLRVVIDTFARIPLESQLVRTADRYPTLVAHAAGAPADKLRALQCFGVQTLLCPSTPGGIDLLHLLTHLGANGIDSLLVEGGGNLNYSFLARGLVDELHAFVAPKIIGGASAKTPVEGEGITRMADAIPFRLTGVEHLGDDLLLKYSKQP